MLNQNKALVIIPSFNEAAAIGAVVDGVRAAAPQADIVVIDDGSSDNTAEAARAHGANVITLPYNLGIGGAMQTGYKYAKENGYGYALQIDGDGQHDPESIGDVLKPLLDDKADLVVGSRHIEDRGYKSSVYRKMGMRLYSRLISVILRQQVTDTTSGYRAVNKKIIDFYADNYPTDYPEVEALVLLHFAGCRIAEVPVSMNVRETGSSSITPIKAAYYMIKVTLAVLIWLIRRKPRLKEVGTDV